MKLYSELIFFLLCLACLLFAFGCKKHKCNNEVPKVEFVDFIQYKDSGKLVLSFYDCNGDVGLKQEEKDPPYDYNLFLTYYQKMNGIWKKFDNLEPPFHQRIPYMEDEIGNGPQEGEIEIRFQKYYRLGAEGDTVKFDILLKDKALNESNVVTTPNLIVPPK